MEIVGIEEQTEFPPIKENKQEEKEETPKTDCDLYKDKKYYYKKKAYKEEEGND